MSVLNTRNGGRREPVHLPADDAVEVGRSCPVADFVTIIAQQCRQRPDDCAVIAADGRLTYRDLAARVSRLAQRLAADGVTGESLVAICMPRGADEVTAMLAVLTLGAAYVPLDPTQPVKRLAMIVDDAQPDFMVTKLQPPSITEERPLPTLNVDDVENPRSAATEPVWDPVEAPEALAYVLFTSGSTGRPKGVEIERRSVSNLFASMARSPGFTETDLVLAASTTMFDVSVLDLFLPLCVGATVRIAEPDVIKDGRRLRRILEDEPVTVMQATPTMWHMLVDSGWLGRPGFRILSGGEALSRDLAGELLARGELWNVYGPTETTVWATCRRIESPDGITVGRPIDNTFLCVLDEHGALLPRGVTGELCIGGPGLARGYCGRPDLTAQQFIQNPLGPPGDRIYRTGDLGRLLENGDCQYLGRLDHQVKIRGYRIELGEIEHALDDLDCVSRAVVVKWEPPGHAATLVAYVVPASGAEFSPGELSRLLRDRVPSYMVPGRYIRLSVLPLTPSGKVDRNALPEPADPADSEVQGLRTASRTETEETLAGIWSEILARRNIAVEDDFFDLGGQSVAAVSICDQIHRIFNVDLPVSALMDHRTIEDLAAHIDGLIAGSAAPEWFSVVAIQPNGPRLPIFCVSGIGGNPMTFLDLANALGEQQPFYGLQYRGVDGKRRPHDSIEAMAREFRHDIQSVQSTGPYVLAGYSGGGLAAYETARLLLDAGEQVELVVMLDTARPGLPGWSRDERAAAHRSAMRAHGPGYVAQRIADRRARVAAAVAMHTRAALARWFPYRFRLDAVEMAGRRAAAAYEPGPYRGDVLLFQSDPRMDSANGIPAKQYESHGWRELVIGQLDVVPVRADHFGIVEDSAAQFVASEISRALSQKRQVGNRRG